MSCACGRLPRNVDAVLAVAASSRLRSATRVERSFCRPLISSSIERISASTDSRSAGCEKALVEVDCVGRDEEAALAEVDALAGTAGRRLGGEGERAVEYGSAGRSSSDGPSTSTGASITRSLPLTLGCGAAEGAGGRARAGRGMSISSNASDSPVDSSGTSMGACELRAGAVTTGSATSSSESSSAWSKSEAIQSSSTSSAGGSSWLAMARGRNAGKLARTEIDVSVLSVRRHFPQAAWMCKTTSNDPAHVDPPPTPLRP